MMHIRPEVLAQQKMAEKSISSHSGSANLHIDGEKVFLGVVGNFQKNSIMTTVILFVKSNRKSVFE